MSQATVHPGPWGPLNRADLVQGFARIHLIAGPAWAGLYLTLLPGRWLGAALGGVVALGAGYAWWASRRDQLLAASLAVILIPWAALTTAWMSGPLTTPVAGLGLALVVVLSLLVLRRAGAILGVGLVAATLWLTSSPVLASKLPDVAAGPVGFQAFIPAFFVALLAAVAWVTAGALSRREASAQTLGERVQDMAERLKLRSADVDDIQARLDQAIGRILEKNRFATFGRLAGGVTHDFANMLSVVLSNAELGLESSTEPTPREALEDIRAAAERAGELSAQILGFLRGDVATTHQPVDLAAHSRDIGRLLRSAIPTTVEIRAIGSEAGWVHGNTTQLTQLIFNLALNGAQAMPDGGVLELEVVRVGPVVRLRVADTGVGMSDEVLAKIFQPLFSTKPAGEGSGLGMTVVEHIVGAHGASLDIRSKLDLGTTMTVEFPAAAPV
jgi:signal transduction histidine kinase